MISPHMHHGTPQRTEHPPMYSWYPPHASWYPSDALMVSPQCTEHPPMYSWYPPHASWYPDVLMISPDVLNTPDVLNIPRCTHDIPHMHHDIPPMHLWYPPNVLNIPRCTHDTPHMHHDIPMYSWYPPMYWTSPDVLNTHYTGCLSVGWLLFVCVACLSSDMVETIELCSGACISAWWKSPCAISSQILGKLAASNIFINWLISCIGDSHGSQTNLQLGNHWGIR